MQAIIWIVIISALGPIIGSFIGIMKKPSERFMYNMLSFAAGVMLAVSFLELIPESIRLSSISSCIVGIIIGSIFMYALDKLLPHIHPELCTQEHGCNLKKTSLYLLIGLFLHNFPEGMAIAIGAVSDIRISLAIAIAIAIQNIPEGICTSAPYYHCTKQKWKTFWISSSTAIPIILGFIVAHYLYQNIPLYLVGVIIGATAGIMIYISGDELIPTSCCKMTNHTTIFSFMIGVILVVLLGLI